MVKEVFNRDTFTKKHYGKSAFAGKLAVAAAALADAWVLAGTSDKAGFLTRALTMAKEYVRDVNGWDSNDAEAMAQTMAGSLRLPAAPFAVNYTDDQSAMAMLDEAHGLGKLNIAEHRTMVNLCNDGATVGEFRAAMRTAEKLRGEVK